MAAKHHLVCFLLLLSVFSPSFSQPTARSDLPPGVVGPESIAFDCSGSGPYVGVSDGRILKYKGSPGQWEQFATVVPHWGPRCTEAYCGRPLGLKFSRDTCDLYIADSTFGIMRVGPGGGVATSVVRGYDNVPFKFANGLDVDPETGVVYFTDSSQRFNRWQWEQVISTMDRTGRLMRYDPRDGSVRVLRGGLAFPNGVALSKDRRFLLVAETTTGQIHKFWLSGSKRNSLEMVIQLGGRPDNVNRDGNGDFWVAQNPTLPNVQHIDGFVGHPIKIDGSGRVLDRLGDVGSTSDVIEVNGNVWLGSVTKTYVVHV